MPSEAQAEQRTQFDSKEGSLAVEEPLKKSKLASALSGSLSGALVSACVQPLDVIRTRMQADSAQGIRNVSTPDTVRKIIKGGSGIRDLWRGTQPTVIRLGVGAGLHFFFLESLKPIFETRDKNNVPCLSSLGAILTGGLSRAMAALISCPITVVKTRMEYAGLDRVGSVPVYKNTADALQTIFRKEGARGLYVGLVPTIASNVPFSAIYYMLYTRLQSRLQQEESLPPTMVNFSSSMVAAVGATLVTQPLDVVRTRMQLSMASPYSTVAVIQTILRTQGMRGLVVGTLPRSLKRTLQTALVWTLYEELSPRLGDIASRLKDNSKNN
jgi:solute carrier family 25 protein 38